jgi:hypothetical protein
MELKDCQYRELFCVRCHEKFVQRNPEILPCRHIICSQCALAVPNSCSKCGDLSIFLPVSADLHLIEVILKLGDLYSKLGGRDLTPAQRFAAAQQILFYLNQVPADLNADLDCLYGNQCPFKGCVYVHPEQRTRAPNQQLGQLLGDSIPPSMTSVSSSGEGGYINLMPNACSRCGNRIEEILPFCVTCGNPIGEIVGGKVLFPPSLS